MLQHKIHIDGQLGFCAGLEDFVQQSSQHLGLNWYARPVALAAKPAMLLVLQETGYIIFLPNLDISSAIEEAICKNLQALLPTDSCLKAVSAPVNCTWHCVKHYPAPVQLQFQVATNLLARCRDVGDACKASNALNQTPLDCLASKLTPQKELKALLIDIADKFGHYTQTAHPLQKKWHLLTGKRPWLAPDYSVTERRWLW